MEHFTVTFKPDCTKVWIHAGATVLEAACQAGIILNSSCGGKDICQKCVVNLEPDGQQVLACQHRVQSDLTVTIPAASRFFEQKILTCGIDIQEKIRSAKGADLNKAAEQIFGLAVDIGTTTIVVKLIDMSNGRCLATEAASNPQSRYGDDVVSRISYADTNAKLANLQKILIDCLNDLIARLCDKTSVEAKSIYEMTAVGNTTMNHILLGFPITGLGQAPYNAFSLAAHDRTAEELGLGIHADANIHTVENIAGFVGSDITAVALAVDMDSAEEVRLVVDIGTNGEIVLGTGDKLYAASCAAGPALEGARISCGGRAADGAIEAVVVNKNDIDLDVIGNCPAHSICGSGLIDAVAVLLDLGIIDRTGRFAEPGKHGEMQASIFSRIITHDGQPAFRLAHNSERDVILTQNDIRQVQLAKAAIRAGIKFLQRKIGLEDSDIEKVLLAGAFGNYIRAESAMRIGLLPEVPIERIQFVGNAAASGAHMILLSRHARALAGELARKIEYVEIAHEADFSDVYAECMSF